MLGPLRAVNVLVVLSPSLPLSAATIRLVRLTLGAGDVIPRLSLAARGVEMTLLGARVVVFGLEPTRVM